MKPNRLDKKLIALFKKIEASDPLDDKELDIAIKFLTEVEWRLSILGPHFHFAWKDVYFRLVAFRDYKQNRQYKS